MKVKNGMRGSSLGRNPVAKIGQCIEKRTRVKTREREKG